MLCLTMLAACSGFDFPLSSNERPGTASTAADVSAQSPAPANTTSTEDETGGSAAGLARPTMDDDLWRRVGVELTLSAPTARQRQNPLHHFGGSTKLIAAAAENAKPFLAYIVGEIEKRELPLEIALIPVIESTYNPRATSPAGAAGIWQLMPATARRFGIQQSRWYDGRRDLISSTAAALDYFESLRDRFIGDWTLVFAAYNCGERTVERAMERNRRAGKPLDFYHLDLPLATREYVPRLFALVEIIAHPEAYDLSLPRVANTIAFETVDVGTSLDLNRVIEWSALPEQSFDHLNAAFRKRFTAPGMPTTVLIPSARIADVERGLAALDPGERGAPRAYVVQSGDTLSHISARTGVPVSVIRHANKLPGSRLAIGQELLIPGPAETHAIADKLATVPLSGSIHSVVQGDNLWDLARRYRTSVARIANANGINAKSRLRLGQKLKIPAAGSQATTPTRRTAAVGGTYKVQSGDSLWTISRRFNVSVSQLKAWNGITAKSYLQPGQLLQVNQPQQVSEQDI